MSMLNISSHKEVAFRMDSPLILKVKSNQKVNKDF